MCTHSKTINQTIQTYFGVDFYDVRERNFIHLAIEKNFPETQIRFAFYRILETFSFALTREIYTH